MREYFDDLNLWSGQDINATDPRARFTCIGTGRHANVTSLLMRDLQVDVVRDGTGDWTVSYAEPDHPERRWTGRSDTYTGAVLTMIARRCGLNGEIRGHLAEDEQP
jgi:hypothetical protein